MRPAAARLGLLLLLTVVALPAADDGIIRVVLGTTVERPFEQLTADGYAYAPQQAYDGGRRETQVFLPYGDTPLTAAGGINLALSNTAKGACAEAATRDSNHITRLQYRLEFDQPITAFRCRMGPYTELVLAPTCMAGVEYSPDGVSWSVLGTPLKGVSTVAAPLLDGTHTIGALNTRQLWLRVFTRDTARPGADTGAKMYIKMRISGDPGWGDAAQTFAPGQNQVWVIAK